MTPPPWIAYVGPFMFPDGQAGSRRVYGVARSLALAGWRVEVASGSPESLTSILLQEEDLGSISYLGLGEIPAPNSSKVDLAIRWLATLGERTVRWLDRQPTKPTHVICYGTYTPLILRLLIWCRRHGVSLIVDVVEWYDSSHLPGGRFGLFNLSSKLALRLLAPKSDGIIAISSYLENYYLQRGCQVLRIPPTLDVMGIPSRLLVQEKSERPLILAYAGIPGKKDLINNIIDAILRVDPSGVTIRLILAGPCADDILRLPALLSRGFTALPECIDALGPQPYDRALNLTRTADFMPLLRPSMRYAQAGFPTKVPESLAVGTPVICNLTSDLSHYIHDGLEGLICRDHSSDAFAEALRRALDLTTQQHAEMRQAARRRAEGAFDCRVFTDQLASFLEDVKRCKE